MSEVLSIAANPFALMMHPADVLQAVERSDRLGSLNRRVYRPLDRPLIPKKGAAQDVDAFDREVDSAEDALPAGE